MIRDHFHNIKLLTEYLKSNDVTDFSAEKLAEVALNIASHDPAERAAETVKVLMSPVHLPTRIFWYKVKRFLSGTFHDFEDQIKMAARFDPTNDDYPKYIQNPLITCQVFFLNPFQLWESISKQATLYIVPSRRLIAIMNL